MKYAVKVMPKKDVLDSQGRATQELLSRNGFELKECKVGKLIEIESEASKEEILKMAEYVLYNPLIEDCEIS